MITFTIKTLGCKVNQSEAEKIQQSLCQAGFSCTSDMQNLDLIIINTCAVTHIAEKKSRQLIRKATKLNPQAKLFVTGCATKTDLKRLREILQVEFIHTDKKLLAEQITQQYAEKISTPFYHAPPRTEIQNLHHTRAYLLVQDGCENYCSYCIIPHIRGHNKPRPLPQIKQELLDLSTKNYQEIVLTGINLGMYHWQKHGLLDVTKLVLEILPSCRIRFGSIEPNLISPELLQAMAQDPRYCRHLHIPLQGGNDNTLRRMNRKYVTTDYAHMISSIRKLMPDIAITTDLIVGFPEETDADFSDTVNFIKKCNFAKIHLFPYSKRQGTPAALMIQTDQDIINTRLETISRIEKEMRITYLNQFIGCPLDVIFEQQKQGKLTGYSSNYLKIMTSNIQLPLNKLLTVTPTLCVEETLIVR